MKKNHAILKTVVLTIIFFISGILAGLFLDNSRIEDLKAKLTSMDIEWNDARLQSIFYQKFLNSPESCENAIKSNLDFNDKIYQEGLEIDRFEEANKLTPELINEKIRYALLQLQFWSNSIDIKKSCNASYSSIVYFYSNFNESKKIDQQIQSIILSDLKDECGNNVILVPLPFDMNISAIEFIKSNYKIDTAPSLLINEQTFLPGVQNREEILKYIKC